MFKLCAFADEAGASLDEQIRALGENKISQIELRAIDGKSHTTFTVEEMKQVRNRLDAAGISVWSLGSPIGKIKLSDDFEAHLELFKHTLELCDAANCKHMRIFSFYEAYNEREKVMEQLGRLLCAARGSGVTLCHENEKGIYGDTASRCVEIHSVFPELKAVFDPANFVQCDQNTYDAFLMLEKHIEYLHIKDADKSGEIVPAGEGIGNIPELLRMYRGEVLTLEPHLASFEGLAELEQGEKSKVSAKYGSRREAFDAAVSALKNIVKEMQA